MHTRIRARVGRHSPNLNNLLASVNQLGPSLQGLPDSELVSHGIDLATRLAVSREAASRTLGERPHDTQVLGAAAMASGRVIEMLTGEGKTLAAAMAVHAMAATNVHVATANDYLADRDAEWMAPLYGLLGLTVGVTVPEMAAEAKRAAYACNVTYGTAREFAFDYLRDTLAAHPDERVQQGHHIALIDEIDFVLLDEARIPFVLTRSTPIDGDGLAEAARVVAALDPEVDFLIDDAQRTVWLTETGIDRVEAIIGPGAMNDPSSLAAADVQLALRARCSVLRDRDYVVTDGRINVVDEFTGRIYRGRRWADGLHQAVEAKEGVPIREDSRALAQITVRSYFGRYAKLTGMSGTVLPAYREFKDVYGLDVVAIAPHRPVLRNDRPDVLFATGEDKFEAVVAEVAGRHDTGQPLLVGTASVAHSEYLSAMLDEQGIPHRVLNAKHHDVEAAIIAEAGRLGAVTVATNMAGRGVDIKLGGRSEEEHDAVSRLGGLCVIGTERHESGRVDDQLRGRAGRQGDPGESMFYAALDDDLVVNYGPRLLQQKLTRPRRAVSVAQSNAETRNREQRSASHEYDEVLDGHYAEICRFREEVVDGPDFGDWTLARTRESGDDATARYREQATRAGAVWETVQRRLMYDVVEQGWSAVLEEMYGLRDWVNLVVFGGDYPITEWRRRCDAAVAAMRRSVVNSYITQLLEAEIVNGLPPVVSGQEEPSQPVSPVATTRPGLPKTARYEPAYREPLIPDWADGFAGPQFREVVVVVDPAGARPRDGVAVVRSGGVTTVYVAR